MSTTKMLALRLVEKTCRSAVKLIVRKAWLTLKAN